MKKKQSKYLAKEFQKALNRHYVAGFEDGRRAGLAEAANVLMEHRDRETGPELPERVFDAPR